jgi:membrane-bound lytic murein transglycosylase D
MQRAKIVLTVLLAVLGWSQAFAQPRQTNDPVGDLHRWFTNNYELDTFDFPYEFDQDQVRAVLGKLQDQFQVTNIYDFAALKPLAVKILPVLHEYVETEPYAAWLQASIDDMDAASEIKRQSKSSSAPSLQLQRSVWVHQLSRASWPASAKTYVPRLKPIFAEEKVPPELVWVAGVESSFNPKARSPAGAAGMFQLMPETAREQHLSLWPFDQRYQPEKSARAAARHLRELHRHYADWELALAAYNVGEGRVDKLLKAHKAGTFEGIARWLPAETQMYVPKVEATLLDREGAALETLKSPAK